MSDSDLQFASALHRSGRFNEAQSAYEGFISKHPRHPQAIYLLGVLHAQQGHFEVAAALFAKAAKVKPLFVEAHYNRGLALNILGHHEQALISYSAALRSNPLHADALKNRLATLLKLKRFEDALKASGQFLDEMGASSEILDMRGLALRELKRLPEALDCHERATRIDPTNISNLVNRGIVLRELDRCDEALVSYDRVLAIDARCSDAHYNKGVALQNVGHSDEALASYDRAIEIAPELAEAHSARGTALEELARFEEALASYHRAIRLDPDYADAHNNRSLTLLLLGKSQEGWKEHEWRKKTFKRLGTRNYRQAEWSGGESIAGRTLFVHWEQGLGDTIQFCRYALLAEARGARVILSVQDALMRLLEGLEPKIEIVDSRSTPEKFDYHVALLSMPLAFGTNESTIPAGIPYLSAEPDRRDKWARRLGEHGFRIGVAWHSSKLGTELGKSFPVIWLHGISKLPGVRLISLQKNEGSEQVMALPEGMTVETLGEDFDSGPDAFVDTAAVMENLDLVITTDTSIAHVAGALGRPTWVALKQVPDWRWLLARNDSPWYPTLRLFRQQTRDDWSSVFSAMEEALAHMIDERRDRTR